MPTENRSSNTEMVSVPPYIGLEPLVGLYYPAQCRSCGWVGSSEELTEDDAQCTRDIGDRLCLGDCDELGRDDLLSIIQAMAQPAPQPHPDPIAWMVGTAFWWTKEEAERDAAATGTPIVGVGPMTDNAPAQQHQGEPVMRLECEKLWGGDGEYAVDFVKPGWLQECREKGGTFLLYTHADHAGVERLLAERKRMDAALVACSNERDTLRAQLAEAHALLREARCCVVEAADSEAGGPTPREAKVVLDKIDAALSASAEPEAT